MTICTVDAERTSASNEVKRIVELMGRYGSRYASLGIVVPFLYAFMLPMKLLNKINTVD